MNEHFKVNRTARRLPFAAALLLPGLLPGLFVGSLTTAEVTFDGSFGAPGTLSGFIDITADRGMQQGPNLFHSFSTFNVDAAELAVFSGPADVTRIISRVTGSSSSTIDGFLESTIDGADFYLMNPNGILIGENAFINVSGSLYFTTASHITLGEAGVLPADINAPVQLTIDPPSSFGFVDSSADVMFAGSSVFPGSLAVPDGENIVLAGGDVSLTNASLQSTAGDVALIATAGETTVMLDEGTVTDVVYTTGADSGATVLVDQAGIDVSGPARGEILLRGGQLVFRDSFAFADNLGNSDGAHLVQAQFDEISIVSTGPQTGITADALAGGMGGAVSLDADTITVTGDQQAGTLAFVGASSLGDGEAGQVIIRSNDLTIDGGLLITSGSASGSGGGLIDIDTADMTVTSGGAVNAFNQGSGRGADVTIDATGSVRLEQGATLQIGSTGTGARGALTINADEFVITDAGSQIFADALAAGTSTGRVSIDARSVQITNSGAISLQTVGDELGEPLSISAEEFVFSGAGSQISGVAFGSGDAGNVSITANSYMQSDQAVLSVRSEGEGAAGNISVRASDELSVDGASVNASSLIGGGGQIELSADRLLSMNNSAEVSTEVNLGAGEAGTILLTAPELIVEDALVNAETGGSGRGGSINLSADLLSVSGTGSVSVSTRAAGDAGDLNVDVTQDFMLGGELASRSSGAQSGAGGRIFVNAEGLQVLPDGIITATTESARAENATADITINVDELSHAGLITATTTGAASAGAIGLSADVVASEGEITAATSGAGNGGLIDVQARVVSLVEGSNTSVQTSGAGDAGSLSVNVTEGLTIGGRVSSLAAAADSGSAGQIMLSGEMLLLEASGEVTALTQSDVADNAAAGISVSATDASLLGTISVATQAAADAGNLSVSAVDLQVQGALSASTTGSGQAGSIDLMSPGAIGFSDSAVVTASTSGVGNGGQIDVNAQSVVLQQGSNVSVETSGAGNAGALSITGSEQLDVSGRISSLAANAGSGSAGQISLASDQLTLAQTGEVTAITRSDRTDTAPAGITVNAESLNFVGSASVATEAGADAGNLSLTASQLAVQGSLSASTASRGNAGSIALTSTGAVIELSDNALLSARTSGSGRAGDISIQGESGLVIDNAVVEARSESSGSGGTISVRATQLDLIEGGRIDTTTIGTGDAGNIDVVVVGDARITGIQSRLSSNSGAGSDGAFGRGGDVRLTAENVFLSSGGSVTATASGSGFAGDVNVTGVSSIEVNDSFIQTDSPRSGGGNVEVFARDLISLTNGGVIASAGGDSVGDDGGNVTIDPILVVLNNGQILARANAGDGGAIFITADTFIKDINSVIDATSTLGNDGEITIESPNDDVNADVGLLDVGIQIIPRMLDDPCAATASGVAGDISTLVVSGIRKIGRIPEDYFLVNYGDGDDLASLTINRTGCSAGF